MKMTIIEALKSSDWIRKTGENFKYSFIENRNGMLYSGDTRVYGIRSKWRANYQDMMETEWEVCTKDVEEIHKEEFLKTAEEQRRRERLIPTHIYKDYPALNGEK